MRSKFLIFFIVNLLFLQLSYAQTLKWGESSKIGISKANIDLIITNYVKENYPLKVEQYHTKIKQLKLDKLSKFSNVIYLENNLMWQDDKDTVDLKLTSLESKIYCKKLNLATKNDWRLPTYDELLHLVDYFRYKPAVIDEIEYITTNRYWTITEDTTDISASWYIDFKYGETGTTLRYLKYNVRCVRDLSKDEGEL